MEHEFNWFHDGKTSIVEITFPQICNTITGYRLNFFLATGTDNRPFGAIEQDLNIGIDLISEGIKADCRNLRLNLLTKLKCELPKLTGYARHRWN